jgi:hypothetical protein
MISSFTPEDFIIFLQQYGPWAITAILLFVIAFLYRQMTKQLNEKDKNYGLLLEKRHDQFIQVLSDCAATLQQAKDEIKETKDLNKKIEELLITVKTILITKVK